MAAAAFPGFPLGMLHFLEELSRNNNRAWFEKHRERYEREVRGPALDFIRAMDRPLGRVSPHLTAAPKKVGGSLMRVHRDTRFSKDKTPYKTNLGVQFRHSAGKNVHAPGVYVHVDTERAFVALGVWRPERDALAGIRAAIDQRPQAWRRAKSGKAFRERFELAGDALKRAPVGYSPDHPQIEDLRRKDHIAVCALSHDEVLSPEIVERCAGAARAGKAYLAFLCAAVGVEF